MVMMAAIAIAIGWSCSDGSGNDESSCVDGEQHCSCYPNDTCNDGLECVDSVCIDPDATDNSETCELGELGCTCGRQRECGTRQCYWRHAHPTLAEAIKEAALDVDDRMLNS